MQPLIPVAFLLGGCDDNIFTENLGGRILLPAGSS
jgi:hypothetical protein